MTTPEERLEKMREAVSEISGQDKPSRVDYCTECDEYTVGGEKLPCDWDSDESSENHTEHHVVGDYEATSIYGYIWALEWVVENE